MRDYGKFLGEMSGYTPSAPTPNTDESFAADDSYQQPVDGYGASYDQTNAQQTAAASTPAPGKRYSADAYEQASTYGYSSAMTQQPYMSVKERRAAMSTSEDENMIMGAIGAVLGASLGVLVWYLIGLAGYISFIGGLAIVAGAFFGYLLLGKGFDKGGALVVGIVVIMSVFVGTRLLYGHAICEAFNEIVNTAISEGYDPDDINYDVIPSLMEASFTDFDYYMDALYSIDHSIKSDYNAMLAESYVFVGVAAIVFFVRRKQRG